MFVVRLIRGFDSLDNILYIDFMSLEDIDAQRPGDLFCQSVHALNLSTDIR